jgi:hypothetical protein
LGKVESKEQRLKSECIMTDLLVHYEVLRDTVDQAEKQLFTQDDNCVTCPICQRFMRAGHWNCSICNKRLEEGHKGNGKD